VRLISAGHAPMLVFAEDSAKAASHLPASASTWHGGTAIMFLRRRTQLPTSRTLRAPARESRETIEHH
jgi:hypothetical protein